MFCDCAWRRPCLSVAEWSSWCPCRCRKCFLVAVVHTWRFMAKRRAEDTLLHDSPSKRCFRPLCGVDMQPESLVPTVGLSPPSLLALLGNRCQKRKHYFEDQEKLEQTASVYRRSTHCDSRKHAGKGLTSGSFRDPRCSSTDTSTEKVPREHCTGSETVPPKATNKVRYW